MGAYKIRIDSIYCAAQKDAKGNAEVWLLAQSDGGAPVRYPQAAMSSRMAASKLLRPSPSET